MSNNIMTHKRLERTHKIPLRPSGKFAEFKRGLQLRKTGGFGIFARAQWQLYQLNKTDGWFYLFHT